MYIPRRKRHRITLVLVILAAVAVLSAGSFVMIRITANSNMPEEPYESGIFTPLPEPPRVNYIEGNVEGQIRESETWSPIDVGDSLDVGSRVRTGKDSFIDLQMQPGCIVRIMPETYVALDALSTEKITLNLTTGIVVSRLRKLLNNQEFIFRTPDSIASVRGTELAVAAKPDITAIYGMSGTVAVRSSDSTSSTVFLGIHQKSRVVKSRRPKKAEAMSQQEIERFQQILDSLHEDTIFLASDKITFKPNSSELTLEAMNELRVIYPRLQLLGERIEVIGHTADIGNPEAQIALSTQRAQTVASFLMELGMPERLLSAKGVGGTRPLFTDEDEDSMSGNRRVEFAVIWE